MCAQQLFFMNLQFSMNHSETLQASSSGSVDVHMAYRLCSDNIYYFFRIANLVFYCHQKIY